MTALSFRLKPPPEPALDLHLPTLPFHLLLSLDGVPSSALHLPALAALLPPSSRRAIAASLRQLAELVDLRGMTMPEAKERLVELSAIGEDWDGDGAPSPAPAALARAEAVLRWADANGAEIVDVDADVLGGIAIWLRGAQGRAWVACMNNGSDTLVTGEGANTTSTPWGERAMERLRTFLTENDGSRAGE